MVDKKQNPFSRLKRDYIFNILVLGFLFSGTCGTRTNIRYCWDGTDDDLEKWMNMSCATKRMSPQNAYSYKIVSDGEVENKTEEGTDFYCMAFKYRETIYDGDGVNIQTENAIFTCDLHNACEDKSMLEGYEYRYDNRDGLLFCCNSGDNCNKHRLIFYKEHQHSCYKAVSGKEQGGIEECSSKTDPCLRIRTHRYEDEMTSKMVSEEFGCDTDHLCQQLNLTDAIEHSCKNEQVDSSTVREVCCCHSDNCFVPDSFEGGMAVNVAHDSGSMNSPWQRTLLIIIGVALGILIVGVTLFFVVKSMRSSKGGPKSPKHLDMKYSSVNNSRGGMDDDHIQILPSSS